MTIYDIIIIYVYKRGIEMKTALKAAGLDLPNPMLRIVTLALPVIPKVQFTDMGLVDVNKQDFIPIFVEE